MDRIRKIWKIIDGNLREARKYAEMALGCRDSHRQSADWYLAMAKSHIDFNAPAYPMIERMVSDMAEHNHELGPGVHAMYMARKEEWMEESAEIKAMIEMYGR